MKVLGVDWGEKRIGLAISEGELAEPFGVVESVEGLIAVVREEGVEKIILGLPEGKNKRRVEELGRRLKEELGAEIVFQNEVLSTKIALEKAIAAGKKRKARRNLDAIAAAVLLQEYLDSK